MAAQPLTSENLFAIVHLAYTTFPADTRVKREAVAAASTGRPTVVVALRTAGQLETETIGRLTVVRLPGRKSRAGPISYLTEYGEFVWRCRQLLDRDPRFRAVRIVHVHTLPDFLVWAATPARRRGAKMILDLHEIFPEFVRSKYRGLLGRIAARLALRLERDARRRADITITVNRPIAALLTARGIGRTERLVLLHNSTDPEEFGPPREPSRSTHPDHLELVYHGTLTALYGIDIAIEGVAQASRQGMDVHFSIIGDGPERPSLERLTHEIGIGQHVTFERPLPQRALRERLARADAGLVPTRLNAMTQYSLSNKLLEYVHLGLPVLATRLPSYRDYLSEDAAWYWTAGDPDALARVITEFTAAPLEERRARAQRAQRELQPFSWERERKRLLNLYQELLAPASASAEAMRADAWPSP